MRSEDGKAAMAAAGRLKCDSCGGKPDQAYFVPGESIQVLAVLCEPCERALDHAIVSFGRSFCTDPACAECKGAA